MMSALSHCRPRARSLAVVLFVIAAGALGVAITAGAQEGEGPEIVAPVQSVATDGPLAVTAFWADLAENPRVIVELASALEVPDAGTYRLSVLMGDPTAGRVRSSMVATDGVIAGSYEEGDGDDWESLGPATVAVDGATVSIDLPRDYVGADAQIWVEAAIDAGDESSSFTTPVFPWSDLIEPSGQTIRSASMAWSGADEQPPPAAVEVPGQLLLTAEGDLLQVSYDGPVPTEVGGVEVTKVVDVVRVADGFDRRAATPFLIAIDHDESTIALLDGTAPLPTEIPNDGEWLLRGLAPTGVADGETVEIGIADLVGVIGVDTTEIGFGVARSITLVDGTVVRADGAVASLTWLLTEPPVDAPAEDDVSPTATNVAGAESAAESGSSSSGIPLALIAIGVVVVGGSVAVVLFMRDRDRRHEEAAGGPMSRPARPVAPEDDRDELNDLTDQLFGP